MVRKSSDKRSTKVRFFLSRPNPLMAQRLAQSSYKAKVGGSNPPQRTNSIKTQSNIWVFYFNYSNPINLNEQ